MKAFAPVSLLGVSPTVLVVNPSVPVNSVGELVAYAKARPEGPFDAIPGPYGAHNWHPMSFNPTTGLVYLPAQNVPINLMDDKEWKRGAVLDNRAGTGTGWNTGMIINAVPPTSNREGNPSRRASRPAAL